MQSIGILYNVPGEKPIFWVGSSYRDLLAFPERARRAAGYNLGLVQNGHAPLDWKPMAGLGQVVREIRIVTGGGASVQHRVVYVATFDEAVYVLHAFEKTSQNTSRHDLEVIRARCRQMLRFRAESEKHRKGG